MALLKLATSNQARNGLILLLIGGLATGCGLLAVFGSGEQEPGFSHAIHGPDGEAGLDCGDCHITIEDEDDPGMPGLAGCEMCHAEEDEAEKPPERRAAAFFADGELKARRVSALDDEIRFSHLRHVEAEIECAECHTGIEESAAIDISMAVTMAECSKCHQEQQVANDCATCHERLDVDVAPNNHESLWMKVHGAAARAHNPTTAEDCSMCHDESSCRTCHQTMEPDSHDNFFRHRGHGLHARMDRQSCATCHRSDSCDACHQDARPRSHSGSFGGALNTHCIGCHLPIESSGCTTCHKGAQHTTATPMPSWHNPASDCRACHGVGLSLPHIDNGDNCTGCHR